MSASTVSITANPAARRRPVVAGEKKSNHVDLVATEAQFNGSGEADKLVAVSQSKDGSHHSIFERTTTSNKDLTRKPNSTLISPPVRRTRKAAAVTPHSKLEKPRWLTVLSVFTKNFMLLLVLIALVQMVRKLALDSPPSSGGNADYSSHFAESEARTAEVESLVKKLVKMIQVQVEVVDKKIDSQVGGLRTEFDAKIHEKGLVLEELRGRFDELDKSFGDFKAVDWLSKEDFNKFVDDFLNNNKGKDSQTHDINLDDIRAYARDIVIKEIEKHAADGLGMVDYALASAGAAPVKHSEPFSPAKGANWLLSTSRYGAHPDAVKMLKPSFGEPGQCFALKGTAGFVQIRLRTAIIPQAFTLEHVAKSVAFDRSSAPKDCRVSGWLEGHDIGIAVDAEKMFLLSEFTYDLEKSNAQTFPALSSVASGLVDTIRLDFTSNHGSSHHTCIYRLRVHGYEPGAASMMTMES
ncbi:SUN domain-containing protein 1-like [Mercurialis annua]|uniref:SUN domain-containing protein 1-like n=1 Tax=Mercurialis annua TaxID=3986 RepID=UPI002160C1EF|nr:SUN domain-containing protein 1-like [Mercurialis annua]